MWLFKNFIDFKNYFWYNLGKNIGDAGLKKIVFFLVIFMLGILNVNGASETLGDLRNTYNDLLRQQQENNQKSDAAKAEIKAEPKTLNLYIHKNKAVIHIRSFANRFELQPFPFYCRFKPKLNTAEAFYLKSSMIFSVTKAIIETILVLEATRTSRPSLVSKNGTSGIS